MEIEHMWQQLWSMAPNPDTTFGTSCGDRKSQVLAKLVRHNSVS